MRLGLIMFVLMALNYGLNTVSFRMVARGSYLGLALTDSLIAAFGFFMIDQIAHAQTVPMFVGYVSGGILGSQIGLWLTRRN